MDLIKMIVVGIDEAGRGPVIGPMVIAGFSLEGSRIKELKEIGVRDSKLLSPKKREEIYKKLINISNKYIIRKISPQRIDFALESSDSNLNLLETKVTAEIINEIKPDKAIIDCPSINEKAYKIKLNSYLKHKCEIVAEHKADTNYVIVGAASILAKVTRDREIEKIKERIGIDFGSGYPSDPKTQRFLREHFKDYNDIFRKSWASYQRLIKKVKQSSLDNFK